MESGFRKQKLGQFECISLSDGSLSYPVDLCFANAPRDQVADLLAARGLPTTHITTPYTCLLVDTGQHKVMIDAGAGPHLGPSASSAFPGIDNSASVTGKLPANLQAAGIDPAEVDTVIFTHAHPDHVAGAVDANHQPVFPNARYFVARREWEFWNSDSAEHAPKVMVQAARSVFGIIRDRLTLIEDETEIVPGISSLAAPGHTPGHIAVAVQSGGEQLLNIADTALHPLLMEHPDWVPGLDMDPETAVRSKRLILERAARDQAYVFAHHFSPFPSLGRVTRQGEGWRWAPIS